MELSHDEVKELIAPYVLGALSDEEAPFVRAHILSCDECMAEADSYSDVAAKMALSVEPVPLSSGFADRVLAAATGAETAEAAEPPRRSAGWSRPSFRRFLPAVVSVAAIVAIAVLSVSLVQTRNKLTEYETVIASVLHSEGGLELGGAGAVARMLPSADGSIFVAAGLQEAPDNHTYELWLIDDGSPQSLGTFSVEDGVAILESDRTLDGIEGAAVTIEPAGGSPSGQPTTDPVMTSGDLG